MLNDDHTVWDKHRGARKWPGGVAVSDWKKPNQVGALPIWLKVGREGGMQMPGARVRGAIQAIQAIQAGHTY